MKNIKNIILSISLSIFIFFILNPINIHALDNRGCPTSYAELQSVSGHKEFLAEVAKERGYTAVNDAGKVDPSANSALIKMKEAAKKEGKNINEISGYRSYNDQVITFFNSSNVTNPIKKCYAGTANRDDVKRQYLARGEASAPPGFSEHHSGKAFDFNSVEKSFENTPEFKWLESNASKYGFRLSYPKNSTKGAGYEPWHWYYIGGGTNEGTPNNDTAGISPATSSAPSTATPTTTAGTVSYQSYTNFPGVGRISSLCQLITALWLLGFAVLLTSVLGMFLYGGYMYVTAGVNAGKVNQAKEIFTNTLTGLIIGLSIFIIINIINPGLLQGNCSIPSVGSGETIGGPPGPSNIIPKPGESVFPTNCSYERPKGGQLFGAPRTNPDGSYRPHAGIDFTPPDSISNSQALQCSILAFRDGTVNESSYGYLGIIHADGVKTRYVHNSKNFVKVGDKVQAGQEIGKMGNVDTGPIHLHFEIYINGAAVNPANVLLDGSANPDPSKVKTTGSPRAQ